MTISYTKSITDVSIFGERFQKASFSLIKMPSQCGRKAKTERKMKLY